VVWGTLVVVRGGSVVVPQWSTVSLVVVQRWFDSSSMVVWEWLGGSL
jgi:hypothetical protein